jgi:hypothetical protein
MDERKLLTPNRLERCKKKKSKGHRNKVHTRQDLVRNDVMYHVDYFATSNITGVRLR